MNKIQMYQFNPSNSTILCEIMKRNKSDKGSEDYMNNWHNYTTFYDMIFKHLRYKDIRPFELGLGSNNINIICNMGKDGRPCASLYGWCEYFPFAQIYGADIDKDILSNNNRFKTYYCDQTNPDDINNMWNIDELKDNFDIIIDDGYHNFEANLCFFENSIHKLKNDGYYIIEDVNVNTCNQFASIIDELNSKYNCQCKLFKLNSSVNNWDNNLLVVRKN